MKMWAVVEHGAPLQCVELPDPAASGTEVVVDVSHCGICHSDVHLWHGGYDMGGGTFFRVADRGATLPLGPGHEIVGRVSSVGPDATGVELGSSVVVYPWIGCGHCARCAAEQDNLCANQRSLGGITNGGFAGKVKVPHPRYVLDHAGIPAALAATYACSGLTVYSAARKILPLWQGDAVVLFGAGGLGLAAIAMLRALGQERIVSVDVSPAKEDAARAAGATAFVSGTDDLPERIKAAAGPIGAAIDFVGKDSTANTAMAVLPKGGKLVVVGIGGGVIPFSVSAAIFRVLSVQASLTGSLPELREVLALARSGKLRPTPVREVPKERADEIIHQLDRGEVIGRVVLTEAA